MCHHVGVWDHLPNLHAEVRHLLGDFKDHNHTGSSGRVYEPPPRVLA